MEQLELAIIGTGWFGLAMARTYLEVNPSHRILILDQSPSIGGVWSKEKLYPELLSNNLLGTFEFSDFPMDSSVYGVKPGQHIPGKTINKYLNDFIERFGLLQYIQLGSKVEIAEHRPDDTWLLTIRHSDPSNASNQTESKRQIVTRRLVVATGLASNPNLPHFDGQESFGKPIFHFADIAKYHDETIQSASATDGSEVKRVAVLGGAKSAWDAAYIYVAAGIPVDWIIRKSGAGPSWMSPIYVTPFKLWLEKIVFTRFLSWFSPCIWGSADGYGRIRSWLHGSAIGRWIVDRFWWVLNNDLLTLNNYDQHPETRKLKPWADSFWIGSMLSILNYPTNFYNFVKTGTIKVHIADIDHMEPGCIHLSNGEKLEAELLCCATGWKHNGTIKFLPEGLDIELGLPHYSSDVNIKDLNRKLDAEIIHRFPRLKEQPTSSSIRDTTPHYADKAKGHEETYNQPFNLYRFIVPPKYFSKRNVGFLGMIMALNTPMLAQAQALWLTAYFNGSVHFSPLQPPNKIYINPPTDSTIGEDIKEIDRMEWETRLVNRFGRWRYPCGLGARFPDFVFDTVPYLDQLWTDIKLEHRRKKGMFTEVFSPYGPEDYRGLVDEWKLISLKESTLADDVAAGNARVNGDTESSGLRQRLLSK